MQIKNKISDDKFIKAVADAKTTSDALRNIGEKISGWAYKAFILRCEELKVSTSHFQWGSQENRSKFPKKLPLEEILIENSPYKSTSSLRERLVRNKILEYVCAECGITEWNSKPISLQLDHINGKKNDNRLENLRLLCPTCHWQTDTHSGKNK